MTEDKTQLNNLPVGFFDSGVGGLSVFSKFKKLLPKESTFYIGDTLHLPYGNKTKEELIGYARAILKFFEKQKVKAVVIACNTSSAQAYETIKNEFDFKIYPIIQSCAKIIASTDIKSVGVFATNATVNSTAYNRELTKYNPNLAVHEIACPQWVNIVEKGLLNTDFCMKEVKQHLDEMMKYKPEKIILGCTHYPYLMKVLTKFKSKEMFIDPAEVFVDFIKKDLEENNLLCTKETVQEKFFVTSAPKQFVDNAKIFYELKQLPEVLNL